MDSTRITTAHLLFTRRERNDWLRKRRAYKRNKGIGMMSWVWIEEIYPTIHYKCHYQ